MASSRSRFSSTEQGHGPSLEARPPDTSSCGAGWPNWPSRTLAAPRRVELVARAAADPVVQLGNGDGSGGLES